MTERMKLVIFIGAMLLVFTMVSLVVRTATDFDDTRDHSSTRANPWGTKAWRELLESSGVQTESWGQPLTALSDDVEFLVVLDPVRSIASEESAALADWLDDGGRLVIAPFAWRDSSGSGGRAAHASLERALQMLGVRPSTGGAAERLAQPATDAPVLADVSRVLVPTDGRLSLIESSPERPDDQRPTVLLRDDQGRAVAVTVTRGRGTAVVLSEAEILANATLPEADNVVLAANLVFAGGAPDRVFFDESHRGLAEAETVFGGPEVDVSPFRNTALALLGVALVYALARARRFGAPIEDEATTRRSAADYVRALAQVHNRAGAASTAASMLAAGLRRRVATAAGVPSTATPEAIAGALTSRGLPGEEIRALLEELEHADERMTDAQLLALAQQVAHYERML